ncbi:MAG: site-specific integrase [Bacilli bacterium]|nr:site-specific integrase [Bacilli bacterium]
MENNNHKRVYLRKDGRYFIKYKKGINQNGKTEYGFIYAKSPEEVLEKYKSTLSKISTIDKSLFSGDIYHWLKSVKISCKKSSYSNYEYMVYAHLIPTFGKYKRKQINKNIINEFTEKMLNRGMAPKTVKDILVILKQILNYHNMNICVTMPKVPKKEIQILTKEHQLLLEQRLSHCIAEEDIGVFLCLYTGIRIGELCGLKWENIDLENNIIRIEKTLIRVKNDDKNKKSKTVVILDDPKSASSIRNIPIPTFLVSKLNTLKKEESCFFLTGTKNFIEPRSYTNHYKNIMKSLNIDEYNFHALRHTFATRCIEKGCDPKTLSEILGHSNVKITLDRYVHPSFDNKVRLMNNLNPMCHFN